MTPTMNVLQIELARHALGLDGRHDRTWRNHFVTGSGNTDHPLWLEMVVAGFAVRRPGSPITGGDDLFHLTRVGAATALRLGEAIGPKTRFPPEPVRVDA